MNPEEDSDEVKHEYDLDIVENQDINVVDCVVLAMVHDVFKNMCLKEIGSCMETLIIRKKY